MSFDTVLRNPGGGFNAVLSLPSGGSTGKIKVFLSGLWVEKPVKVWNGTAWVEKPLKVWNGSVWTLA